MTDTADGFWSTLWNYGWLPTTENHLEESERNLLKDLKTPFKKLFVPVNGANINTIVLGEGPPLILIHGFGAALGHFIKNFDYLAQYHTVYACDLIGFGRSCRLKFQGSNTEEAESFFIDHIVGWLDYLKLDSYYLLGHSLGGYLVSVFAMKYPEKIKGLILADPWGVPERQPEDLPVKWKMLHYLFHTVRSPFTFLRASGPLGPKLISATRFDLIDKFKDSEDPNVFINYIYHSNVQEPSGEYPFVEYLQVPWGWAKSPLSPRFHKIPSSIPITVIIGDRSWINHNYILDLKEKLPNYSIKLFVVQDATHHVHVDEPDEFNRIVIESIQNNLKEVPVPRKPVSKTGFKGR